MQLIELLKHELQESQREVAALKLITSKNPQPAPMTSQPNGTAPITSQPGVTAQRALITTQPNGTAQPAHITSQPRDVVQSSAAAAEQLPSIPQVRVPHISIFHTRCNTLHYFTIQPDDAAQPSAAAAKQLPQMPLEGSCLAMPAVGLEENF
jgi:hypothetical protein